MTKYKISVENGNDWEMFVVDTDTLEDTETSSGWNVKIQEYHEQETSFGICKNCIDEYDEPHETKLFKINGRFICGDCANNWENEEREYQSRYGDK